MSIIDLQLEPLIAEYKKSGDLDVAGELACRISTLVQNVLYRRVRIIEHRNELYSMLMVKVFNPEFLQKYDEKKSRFATFMEKVAKNEVASYFKDVCIEKSRILAISGEMEDLENCVVFEPADNSVIPGESRRFAHELLSRTGDAVYSIQNDLHRQIYIIYILCRTEIKHESLASIFNEKSSSVRSILRRCKDRVRRVLQKQFNEKLGDISENDYRAAAEMFSDFHYWTAPLDEEEQLSALAELSSLGSFEEAASNLGFSLEKTGELIRNAAATIALIEPESSMRGVKENLLPYSLLKCEYLTVKQEIYKASRLSRLDEFVENIGRRAYIKTGTKRDSVVSVNGAGIAEPFADYAFTAKGVDLPITPGLETVTIEYLLKAFES